MENNLVPSKKLPNWQNCIHCPNLLFDTVANFERHLKEKHTIKEGSIILCQYDNGLCTALQFGDLYKAGFRYHVREHHSYIQEKVENWTFYSSSQNLPAVLNDPNRGKQSNFFTKTWGESFVDKVDIYHSPYLPEITLAHFESYCKRIGKRLRRHVALKEQAAAKAKAPSLDDDCEIPSIFYEENFQLNDPKIFHQVFPNLSTQEDPLAGVLNIHETLSTYLDVIEMRISKQVAQKSDAFFHAMLSHDTIMEQMVKAVKTVQQTRQRLAVVKENLTESPLKLITLTKRSKNMKTVHEILKLMSTVQQTQPMIQLLLSTSDYVAALDLISSTQKVLATQLAGIQALRHLSPQLTEMKKLIHKMLSSEFQKFIVSDLNRLVVDNDYDIPNKDKLISIVSGIIRLKEFDFVDTFKSEAMATIQTTIKQVVIEIVSLREAPTEIVLRGSNADNMSLLCNEGISFLQNVSPSLINLFKRIMCITSLILEISQTEDLCNDNEEYWSKVDLEALEMKLKKMTASLSDYCCERCANLIVMKGDKDHVLSDFSQLSKLSELIENFTAACDNITGHSNNTMKLAYRSFATKFVQSLHSERRGQLNASLNCERWKPSDVPSELQSVIDDICETGEIPPVLSYRKENQDGKYLIINKEKFAVVASVQLLMKILLEYCDATRQSPSTVQYLVSCMLELTRLFNSRCCQLVLGAGAIQSAGLKTISTSNLALVSRSLQVVLWLLPLVKKLVETLKLKERELNGFVSLESDMNSHKLELENKICFVVSSMLTSQLSGWEAKPPVPSQTFRNVSKHLVKLHEALIDILPKEQIRNIYKSVHENFKVKLKEQLVKMNIVANGSPQHGVVTSELTFYLQTLKTLRIIHENDSEDNILYDIWLN